MGAHHLNSSSQPTFIRRVRNYTRFEPFTDEGDNAVFSKRQDSLQFACREGMKHLHSNFSAKLTERELYMCELLRLNPHLNIAEYRGVVCQEWLKFDHNDFQSLTKLDTERVIEIKFKRYDCTL
jgi:hypothetical protein